MSYWQFILMLMALVSGALMPLQAGINGLLAKQVHGVLPAATISFIVGTCALIIIVLLQKQVPSITTLKSLHWWHWAGGLMGAFFVTTAALAGPKLGALLFMTLVLAGQLMSAMTLDHFALVGYKEAALSLSKIAGLLLIVAGIWLIQRA